MHFKSSSELKLGDISVALTGLKSDKVTICDLKGKDLKCAQCMLPLQEGEDIVVLTDTKFLDNEVELDGQLQIVHIMNDSGHCCIEDYMARLTSKYETLINQRVPTNGTASVQETVVVTEK